MTFLGQNSISDLRLGDSQVQAAYLGNMKLWPEEQPAGDYWGLCFTAEEPNASISMTGSGTPPTLDLLYSTDSQTWSTFTPGTATVTLANVGDKVWFKAGSGGNSGTADSTSNYLSFSITNRVAASGNIMSLLNGQNAINVISQNYAFYKLFNNCSSLTQAPELPATTLAGSCYQYMFQSCTSLIAAPVLQATVLSSNCYSNMFQNCYSLTSAPALPATTLAVACYETMFSGCSSLTSAPTLPATTLAGSCYNGMFSSCTSLVQAPALPATALASNCYYQMFNNCSSLTQAPALPATTLVQRCYQSMFRNCISLSSISADFTAWTPSNATTNWVTNILSSGTFYCPTALGTNDTISRGTNYCPTDWTVVNTDA